MLAFIRKQKLKDKEMRILMLGLDMAGKTTIVKRLMNKPLDGISPTLGFEITTYTYEDKGGSDSGDTYNLNIWDVGGQETLRSYWRNYFEKTDCLIWVVDAADKGRMQKCRQLLHELLLEERLMGSSLLVFANKMDVENAVSAQGLEEILDLQKLKASHAYEIIECSAMEGRGVKEGIDWVVRDAKKRMFLY